MTTRWRLLLATVALPLIVAAVAVGLMALWLPDLPAKVVVHWGIDGVEFGSPLTYLALTTGIALFITALMGVIVGSSIRDSRVSFFEKLIAVSPSFVVGLISAIAVSVLFVQRGTVAGYGVPNPTAEIIGSAVFAVALAIAAWFVLPVATDLLPHDGHGAVVPLLLASGDRVIWIRRTSSPRALTFTLVLLAVALFGMAVVAAVLVGPKIWWVFVSPVVVTLALASSLSWVVRVDETGLLVRSTLGIPRFRVPLAEVANAIVTTVAPIADFGGWGVRFGRNRRMGVIVHAGEALEVVRKDGRSVVVTVRDAQTAASALLGLAGRST